MIKIPAGNLHLIQRRLTEAKRKKKVGKVLLDHQNLNIPETICVILR